VSNLEIAEVFGNDVNGKPSKTAIKKKNCPFISRPCTKGNAKDPLGICSFGDGASACPVCPIRFQESDRIFKDCGRLVFGKGSRITIAPEIRILQAPNGKKIGKVDFILGKLDDSDEVCDFAALEVQSVYITGESIRPAFKRFCKTLILPNNTERRLDFRSSAQKRLMPQLSLKVPVFRRWGKKVFVAVDKLFFESLPRIDTTDQLDNSEVTWLVYSFTKKPNLGYTICEPEIKFTLWDSVLNALREGKEPTKSEIMHYITANRAKYKLLAL